MCSDDLLSVKIDSLVYGGYGLGRLPDGKAVFVPFVLPGEQVLIHVVKEKRGHAVAELISIEESHPERIKARCVHFGVCGGCHYQHIPYKNQLEFKKIIFLEQLRRLAEIEVPEKHEVNPSLSEWNYRNSLQFHLNAQGKLNFADNSHNQLFEVRDCHLPLNQISQYWPRTEFESGTGIQRVEYRQNAVGNLLMVLSGSQKHMPEMSSESSVSIVHLDGEDCIVLAGDDHLFMKVKDRDFKVSAGSFFQTNFSGAQLLVENVTSIVNDHNPIAVLDVYCGVGLFSSFLAEMVENISGIESSRFACEDYIENLDQFDHISLFQGKAEHIMPNLEQRFDCILIDPPRAGLDREVIRAILEQSPELLVYVSCNPATLARDARYLVQSGYRLESSIIVDMFPQTYHIESINKFIKG